MNLEREQFDFERRLADDLAALADGAPAGPGPAAVRAALRRRAVRRFVGGAAGACAAAAAIIVAVAVWKPANPASATSEKPESVAVAGKNAGRQRVVRDSPMPPMPTLRMDVPTATTPQTGNLRFDLPWMSMRRPSAADMPGIRMTMSIPGTSRRSRT